MFVRVRPERLVSSPTRAWGYSSSRLEDFFMGMKKFWYDHGSRADSRLLQVFHLLCEAPLMHYCTLSLLCV